MILVADGEYRLTGDLPIRSPMVICGGSKDPSKVRIIGDGSRAAHHLRVNIYSDDFTIAHVTHHPTSV